MIYVIMTQSTNCTVSHEYLSRVLLTLKINRLWKLDIKETYDFSSVSPHNVNSVFSAL